MASVAPIANVPPASAGKPARSASQRTTRRSIVVVARDSSATACDGLSAATSGSVQIAAGSGTDSWCAMCIGSCSHAAFGSTRADAAPAPRPAAVRSRAPARRTAPARRRATAATGVSPRPGGGQEARDDAGDGLARLRPRVGEDLVERPHAAQPASGMEPPGSRSCTVTPPSPSLPSSSRRPAGVPVSAGNVPQWPPRTRCTPSSRTA